MAPPKKRSGKKATVKRCTRYVRLKGGFPHQDKAGANKVHWKGTLRGERLAAGSFKLLVRPYRGKLRGELSAKAFRVKT